MKTLKRGKRMMALLLAAALCLTSIQLPEAAFAAKKKAVKKITVTNPPVKTLAMKKGETVKLKVKVTPTSAKKNVTYKSSKKSVVTVSKKGVIKAKKKGTAKVTVASTTKPKKKVTITVSVLKKFTKVKKITLNKKSKTLKVGESFRLTAKFSPKKPTWKKVQYVSGKKSVATVTSKGVVKAKKAGTAIIAVYAKDGRGAKAKCKITVQNRTDAVPTPTEAPQVKAPLPQTEKDAYLITKGNLVSDIYVDAKAGDYAGLYKVAQSFQKDVALVSTSNATPDIVTNAADLQCGAIIVGSIGNNDVIDALIAAGKLDVSDIKGKWETYKIQVVDNPTTGVDKGIVVVGSDKRGTIYGLYHISEMMGVSPWVYWGDVVPQAQENISFKDADLKTVSKEPSVKYRGIFLNDEAPSLTGWVKSKFGNYNENFYELVFELILRCKGNYLWPAMWSNSFSDDGKAFSTANAQLANEYGIVMGTSHHEPLCRAGVEWQRSYNKYGSSNAWDFAKNKTAITKFWEGGVDRNKAFENVYTLGMRGESDSALEGTIAENIALLKDVISTQKQILAKRNLTNAPKVFTVYKEVEDFWNGTDTVEGLKNWSELQDTVIMLCDDNFGNMRTLPTAAEKDRTGGWGMYYHFDYHGGPVSYEWVNTVQLEKVWEQMTMAYEHGVDDIWIVNVGDLKPMEMNISYFLDMAYDYDTWGKGQNKTETYRDQWLKQQFGKALNDDQLSDLNTLMKDYTWLNTSCKPETLGSGTYDASNYNEAMNVLERIESMQKLAEQYKAVVPADLQAAYFELVYFPVMASSTVTKMQLYSGLNQYYYNQGSTQANLYGMLLSQEIATDKQLQKTYNNDIPGVGNKWKNMMSSPHVGFTSWNSDGWSYPTAKWYESANDAQMMLKLENKKELVANGTTSLDAFTSTGKKSSRIDVSNGGGKSFKYTVTPSDDWITVSKTEGKLKAHDYFDVSVDFDKIDKDSEGTIEITGAGSTVTVTVTAKITDTTGLDEKTYLFENGYASIMPGNYTTKAAGKNGAEMITIEHYGKMGQSVKALMDAGKETDDPAEAPYVEYTVKVDRAGVYKLTAFTAPSNNIEGNKVQIRYAVGVNDGEGEVVNTINESYVAGSYAGSSTWQQDVKASGRKRETDVTLKEGLNTIRIYALDSTFILQKLVVSEESVAPSHLGPEESYYVGKNVTAHTYPVPITDSIFMLPGAVDAYDYVGSTETDTVLHATAGKEYTYPVFVTSDKKFNWNVKASAKESASVKLYLGDTEVGTASVEGDKVTTKFATTQLEAGAYTLRLVVENGNVDVENISMQVKTAPKLPMTVEASSSVAGYEAKKVSDEDISTSWKPESGEEAWVSFDLKGEYYIDRFSMVENGSHVTGYELQIWKDNDWLTVYTGDTVKNNSKIFIQGREAYKSDKIRFVFKGTDIDMAEINIVPFLNWAMDDTVTLEGKTASGKELTIPPNVLIDGDRITKGLEEGPGTTTSPNFHKVYMNFTEPRKINAVRVTTLQAEEKEKQEGIIPDNTLLSKYGQKVYKVSYFNGTDWVVIGETATTESNTKVFNEFFLEEEVTTDRILVEVGTTNWVRINEIEAVYEQGFKPGN